MGGKMSRLDAAALPEVARAGQRSASVGGVVGLLWTPSWTTGGQWAVSLLVTTSLAFPISSSVLKEAVPLISCRLASCHLVGATRLGQCIALYIPGR